MSGSRTIIKDEDWLENVHPGDVLRDDFLIGSEIGVDEVAQEAGIEAARIASLLAGKIAVDADIDLRLGRYFDVSEGFFLRLQNLYDLEEFRREHGSELDSIVPRAA